MKVFYLLLSILGSTFLTTAQAQKVVPGRYKTMIVSTVPFGKHQGYLQYVSDTTVSIMLSKGKSAGVSLIIPYQNVHNIVITKKRKRHGLGAFVGVITGFTIGFAVAKLTITPCQPNEYLCFRDLGVFVSAIGTGLGGGIIGGIIGLPRQEEFMIHGNQLRFETIKPRLRQFSYEVER